MTNSIGRTTGQTTKDIDRIDLLKILFEKLLGDNKIDGAEKTLFAGFKAEFGISDAKYSEVLAETVAEIKEKGNIFTGGCNLDENGREYKISIYREAYYRMLLNGKITEGENDLLIGLNKILKLEEDAESEAVLDANAMAVDEAAENISAKNYNAAAALLEAFTPDKKHFRRYYQTAYSLFKNRAAASSAAASGDSAAREAADEFEKLFIAGKPNEKAAPWEAFYYHARLVPLSEFEKREKCLNAALEAADDEEKKHLAYFQIAFSYQAVKNYEKAAEFYSLSEKHDDGDADTAVNLISCLLSLKQYDRAKKYADEKFEKFSASAAFINNCAILHLKLNDRGRAAELFKKALAVDPGFADARVNLSKIM
jgi:tetratricopeptide (TPR) repeat protein